VVATPDELPQDPWSRPLGGRVYVLLPAGRGNHVHGDTQTRELVDDQVAERGDGPPVAEDPELAAAEARHRDDVLVGEVDVFTAMT
jgi:hypothetical protein